MPRITKITTRRGDDGSTDLADGGRVRKDSKRIRAIGALDELNSAIGLAAAWQPQPETGTWLREVQNDLLCLGAMLSIRAGRRKGAGPSLDPERRLALERVIETLQKQLGPLGNFLLPGGTPCAAGLQFARTVCRRAEGEVVALARTETVSVEIPLYLNRLSDLLFQLARVENQAANHSESLWNSR
jgi:cob(I)alamin adenosyltransferase